MNKYLTGLSTSMLLVLYSGCASSPQKVDVVIRDFAGNTTDGNEVRLALESQVTRLKQFRVIARDLASMDLVRQEAATGKNQDDLFVRKGSGVKLGEGLAGTKVIHGSCTRTKDKHARKVGFWDFPPMIGWLFGLSYNDQVYTHTAYCTYRVINAESHIQELAGDATPQSWTNSEENAPMDPYVARSIASEMLNDIATQLKEAK